MGEHWLLKAKEARPLLGIDTSEMRKYYPHLLVVQTPGAPLHVRNYITVLLAFLDKRQLTVELARRFAGSSEAVRIGNDARQFYAVTAARMASDHLLTTLDLMRLFNIGKAALSSWSKGGLNGRRAKGVKTYPLTEVMRACVMRGPGGD